MCFVCICMSICLFTYKYNSQRVNVTVGEKKRTKLIWTKHVYTWKTCVYTCKKEKHLAAFYVYVCLYFSCIYIHDSQQNHGGKREENADERMYMYMHICIYLYTYTGEKKRACVEVWRNGREKETDQLKIHIYVYTCKQKKKHVPVWKRGETDKKRKFRK